MAGNQYHNPGLGATFYPGSEDEYYMPELISPTPQRIMPEIPSQMQDGLANLELEARATRQQSKTSQPVVHSPYMHTQYGATRSPKATQQQGSETSARQRSGDNYKGTNASAYQDINRGQARHDELPRSSPFPKVMNPGPNVPLSDEEKEDVLERARPLVLQSTDPEMQLAWAQDALSWVEAADQAYLRQTESGLEPPRAATPHVEHQLRVDALNIVCFLAEQQHPKAEFMRGMWLEFGKFGYRVDKKEAFLAYRRAAERGYARAEYRIGMQFESTNNSAKATDHYLKGVELGDSASNYRLGMMTLLGQHGMAQNYQHGVDLIRLAADTADENAPQGAYIYGMLLARELSNITVPEEIIPYNLVDAKLYIEKAAYLGFAKAQLKMAQAYELCQLGCDFEPTLSLHYNSLAARQGEDKADMAISRWFLCGHEGLFEKNNKLAYEYACRAATRINDIAEFAMGYFYETGIGVPMNLEEAEKWYKIARDHGNKDAIGRINSIKQNKALSKDDHEKEAIRRIRTQHGSQRRVRPDRFKQKPPPMAAMPETRPVSTAPYPDDQHPLRPNSPYRNQGLRPQVGPIADRPASAFGIRTPQSPQCNPDVRPASSIGNTSLPAGRGQLGGPGRPLSVWEGAQEPRKQPSPGPQRPPKQAMNKQYPQQTPNAGMGYGYDQSQQGSKTGFADMGNVQPRRDPAANKLIRPDRNSSMSTTFPVVSPRTDLMVDTLQPIARGTPVGHGPMRAAPTTDSRQSSISSATMSPPSAPPERKKKAKVPKTFEEMGIPQAKDQSECVVM